MPTASTASTPSHPGTPTPAEPKPARPEPRDQEPLAFDWVEIPAGDFLMGSDPRTDHRALSDEQPQHAVYLSTYWLNRTPVTVRQFARFIQAARYTPDKYWTAYYTPARASTYATHPVVLVTYDDALAFCRWAHVRLLTEAQWEKAARGPAGLLYPRGNQPPTAGLCNFNSLGKGTTPVGAYPAGASPYGLLDMAGNVDEWCSDFYDAQTYRSRAAGPTPRDPTDPAAGTHHILRGGSHYSDATSVRCAYRSGASLPSGSSASGFGLPGVLRKHPVLCLLSPVRCSR